MCKDLSRYDTRPNRGSSVNEMNDSGTKHQNHGSLRPRSELEEVTPFHYRRLVSIHNQYWHKIIDMVHQRRYESSRLCGERCVRFDHVVLLGIEVLKNDSVDARNALYMDAKEKHPCANLAATGEMKTAGTCV